MRFTASNQPAPVFPTYGIHNPPQYSPCAAPDCLYARAPGEPSDPTLPLFWSARWTMYRVFNKYVEFPPPYDGPPPAELTEGEDYQISYGVSFYDSTWRGPDGEHGAMMEHYIDWSLPIFPFDNHFTSSFVSLGNNAYFLTYDQDRPQDMVPICRFSDLNHPPRRDFVKHLPYSRADSERLGGRVQGYSFWASPEPGPAADPGRRQPGPNGRPGGAVRVRVSQPVGARPGGCPGRALPASALVLLLRTPERSTERAHRQSVLHGIRDDQTRPGRHVGPGHEVRRRETDPRVQSFRRVTRRAPDRSVASLPFCRRIRSTIDRWRKMCP